MEGPSAAQPSHEPEPVEARHLEIAEDEIGLDFGEELEGLFTIAGRAGPHAECVEQRHRDVPGVLVVVDHEDTDSRDSRWPFRAGRHGRHERTL